MNAENARQCLTEIGCSPERINPLAELVEAGMSDAWIMKNIGMDAEELLRLKQLTGLQSLFKDRDFSSSWEMTA